MPEPATERASVLKAASVAERWLLESIRLGDGSRTVQDAMLTIRPQPRSRIPGTPRAINSSGASTSVRRRAPTRRAPGPADPRGRRTARVGDEDLDRPERRGHGVDERRNAVELGVVVHERAWHRSRAATARAPRREREAIATRLPRRRVRWRSRGRSPSRRRARARRVRRSRDPSGAPGGPAGRGAPVRTTARTGRSRRHRRASAARPRPRRCWGARRARPRRACGARGEREHARGRERAGDPGDWTDDPPPVREEVRAQRDGEHRGERADEQVCERGAAPRGSSGSLDHSSRLSPARV